MMMMMMMREIERDRQTDRNGWTDGETNCHIDKQSERQTKYIH